MTWHASTMVSLDGKMPLYPVLDVSFHHGWYPDIVDKNKIGSALINVKRLRIRFIMTKKKIFIYIIFLYIISQVKPT